MTALRLGAIAGALLFATMRLSAQSAPPAPTGVMLGLSGSEPAYWTRATTLQARW